MSKIVLNDVFNEWLNSKGILNVLTTNFEVPWKNAVDGSVLDLEYHGNHSGQKIIAPLVEKLITEDGISDENARKLAGVIYYRNITNWQKLWDTLSFDYNPIHNVDAVEIKKIHKGEQTDTFDKGAQVNELSKGEQIDKSKFGQHTDTIDLGPQTNDNTIGAQTTTNTNGSQSTTTVNGIAGFNSSDYSNADKSKTDSDSYTDTSAVSARTDSNTLGSRHDSETFGERNDEITYGERLDSTTDGARHDSSVSGERDDEEELERKGNIGVTTTQNLISQERKLWDWKFFDRVFDDIDNILVIDIYGEFHGSCEGLVINTNSYVLPVASESILGGVKPVSKSELMNMSVGVDAEGRLWSIQEVSSDEFEELSDSVNDVKSTVESLDDSKQDKLVSGVNIATINGVSLLDGGDIIIKGGGAINSAISSFNSIFSASRPITYSIEKEVQ